MTAPAPSLSDLYSIAVTEMVVRRPELAVNEGDITDAMAMGIAAAGDAAIRQAVFEFQQTFFSGAKAARLDRLIDDRLALARIEAAQAVGTLSFERPTAGAGGGTIAAGHRVATAIDASGNQVVVTTDSAVVFGGAALGPLTVACTATVAGTAGNAAAATLVNHLDTPFDTTITVTNPAVMSGGSAGQSDDAYVQSARDFYNALRRATQRAIEFGAKQVPQVKVATATVSDTGIVTVYVSDADGNSNIQMVALVEAELVSWAAYGVTITVVGGVVFSQDLTGVLTVRAGYSVPANLTALQAAAVARMTKLRAGETMLLDAISSAITAVDPDNILGVTFSVPAANVVPAANQIIRAGTVSLG